MATTTSVVLVVTACLCASTVSLTSSDECSSLSPLVWAVELHQNGQDGVVAMDTGLSHHGTISGLLSHVHEYRLSQCAHQVMADRLGSTKAAMEHAHAVLEQHPHVKTARLQTPLVRQRRKKTEPSMFNDPCFKNQWHLINAREPGHDINVTGAWAANITGVGVVVAVVDDGLEYMNPELQLNFNADGSYDFNGEDADPTPDLTVLSNTHGTKCAGLVAAIADNNLCGVGVAYRGQVSGIRMLDGTITDLLEAKSLTYEPHINHIYSCSWGPTDDGMTVEAPGQLAQLAFQRGAREGRYGYGNIYVFASGNGGMSSDNCNYDGYANSIYTVTIGALDEQDKAPYYAERCAALLAVTYSNGNRGGDRNIVTADINKNADCTDGFSGTSAAAPMAAGVLALALQVRPCLTWRDVQSLVVYTVLPIDFVDAQWVENRAGFNHSHLHGFGVLDAYRLTMAAKTWKLLSDQVSWTSPTQHVDTDIPPPTDTPLTSLLTLTSSQLPPDLNTLEHVAVKVNIAHSYRGHLAINLTCPSGTQSELATPRKHDKSSSGLTDWSFTTVRCWGEVPVGSWLLTIRHNDGAGTLVNWRLTLHGSNMTTSKIIERRQAVIAAISSGGEGAVECPPHPNDLNPIIFVDHDKRNKILRALSAIAVIVVTILLLYIVIMRLFKRCFEWKRFHSQLPAVRLRKDDEEGGDIALLLGDTRRDSLGGTEEEESDCSETNNSQSHKPPDDK